MANPEPVDIPALKEAKASATCVDDNDDVAVKVNPPIVKEPPAAKALKVTAEV